MTLCSLFYLVMCVFSFSTTRLVNKVVCESANTVKYRRGISVSRCVIINRFNTAQP